MKSTEFQTQCVALLFDRVRRKIVLSLKPAWSTWGIPGHFELQGKALYWNKLEIVEVAKDY